MFDIHQTPICAESSHNHLSAWLFSFGAYGDTHVIVMGQSLDDALECALEWLDDNAPGLLHTIEREDYERAARELNIVWDANDLNDDSYCRVVERAEQDMTMVTHTTLKHGNCIPSWEWSVRELDNQELKIVRSRLAAEE